MNTKRKVPLCVTLVLLVAAIGSCIFGATRGEMKTVYRKAANICMECIGIG
ncbi:hypothetical protein SAMN04487884_11234 [Butyrivibrio fibrisolvens]|uniref:Thioredoxin n=1 Tax=Butyrivibrio fibrisolvens TaxID=831 RepID=A0A1H9SGC2_BUTFI|nr:CD1871A family CXXC motif-containing protein [Butyrivibrio fibrisolvens]SER84042.1 hypothetical protein SAMN04487884_11234 [Butyrivibrio fibrisolvens]